MKIDVPSCFGLFHANIASLNLHLISISINGFESNLRDISCGVPQGSSLGPLLFLIYINDFRLCLQKTETGHFADDTFIMFGSKKLATIETVVNHELKLVTKWLRLNRLSLNAGKIE